MCDVTIKLLTMTSSDRASPATVGRCGMIYLESELLGWRPLKDSFLESLPKSAFNQEMVNIIHRNRNQPFDIFCNGRPKPSTNQRSGVTVNLNWGCSLIFYQMSSIPVRWKIFRKHYLPLPWQLRLLKHRLK